MPELLHAEITKAVIGAFYDVFHELGHGYSEKIYRRALAIVLQERGFDVIEERHIKVVFHGTNIGTFYVDLVVNGKVIVEIKAAKDLDPRDEAQTLNYLKCAGGGIALLVNFGRELKYKRLVMGDPAANLPNLI
jgi:GxxExxY protein